MIALGRLLDRTGAFHRADQFGLSALHLFQIELLKILQDREDELAQELREDTYKQRILASSIGPHDPELFWHLFDPDEAPSQTKNQNHIPGMGSIVQPQSLEEFEDLISLMEQDEALEQFFNKPDDDPTTNESPYYPVQIQDNRDNASNRDNQDLWSPADGMSN